MGVASVGVASVGVASDGEPSLTVPAFAGAGSGEPSVEGASAGVPILGTVQDVDSVAWVARVSAAVVGVARVRAAGVGVARVGVSRARGAKHDEAILGVARAGDGRATGASLGVGLAATCRRRTAAKGSPAVGWSSPCPWPETEGDGSPVACSPAVRTTGVPSSSKRLAPRVDGLCPTIAELTRAPGRSERQARRWRPARLGPREACHLQGRGCAKAPSS